MGRSKLTNEQIEEIKQRYIPSKGGSIVGPAMKHIGSMSQLAEEFDVSPSTIHSVIHGRRKNNKTVIERFMQYVQKSDTGCWLWIGGCDVDGYGGFALNPTVKRAHVASYVLFRGRVRKGLCVCHSCDTPACVNPDHLWLGTNKQNIEDKIKKGRAPRGENNSAAKLTEQEVIEIRNGYIPRTGGRPVGFRLDARESVGSMKWLAEKYKVSRLTIKHIIRGHTWKYLLNR